MAVGLVLSERAHKLSAAKFYLLLELLLFGHKLQ